MRAETGWKSIVQPENLVVYFAAMKWREWSQDLDHAGDPLLLALPEERPLAAFYRHWPPRVVAFKPEPGNNMLTAEDFVRGEKGWVIVPATRFIGREGHVAAKVLLFDGNENSIFSLASLSNIGRRRKAHVDRLSANGAWRRENLYHL